jgi:hypothetical protein
MRTAALSGRRRAPLQVEQAALPRNWAYQRLARSEEVCMKRRSRRGTTPSQAMSNWPLPDFPFQRTSKVRSPVPQSRSSRWRRGRRRQRRSVSMPSCSTIWPRKPWAQPVFSETFGPQGLMAPPSMLSESSGTTRSGSISTREPRPLQSTHMPCGLLKEKLWGVSSGNEMPQSAQAIFSE